MSCCDPCIQNDKEVKGNCKLCEGDINQDGETIEDTCKYSPLDCEECGSQPCDWSC